MPIGGSGGGKQSSPRAPVEAKNTLRAKQTVRVVHLISEGPVAGLIDGGKSIYLDDTPLIAADGTANFQGVTFEVRTGEANQEPLLGYPTTESTTAVNVALTKGGGAQTRVVNLTGIDRVRVTVAVQALYSSDSSTGDINPTSVNYQIQWRVAGTSNAFAVLWNDVISGKCVAPYARALTFRAPHNGNIELRLVRITDDATNSSLQNATAWQSFATIVDRKLIYPGSALVALTYDAELFGGNFPQTTFDGNWLICQVPANYNPTTRAYATTGPGTSGGVWDGTFKAAHTSNPAWILWTLLTNPSWGCGAEIPASSIDRYQLYVIAQYCDELVDDGFGGQEPRYSFNHWINVRDEAMRVIAAITAAFRGMCYWGAGTIVPVADMPLPVVQDVNPSNVIDGKIEYETAGNRARHSMVKVRWRDPATGFRQSIEVVEDAELIAEIGVRDTEFDAVGCTSRGLARRLGRWILYTEKYETRVARYGAGLDHVGVRPGEIVAVQDRRLAGADLSGRLANVASATQVTLDRPVTLAAGFAWKLITWGLDGTRSGAIDITNSLPVTTRDLTLGPGLASLPELPGPGSLFTVQSAQLAPQKFKMIAVEESGPNQYALTGLQHFDGKFAYIEQGLALDDAPFSIFRPVGAGLPAPTNPTVVEYVAGTGATTLVRADLSWTPVNDARVKGYEAQALRNGGIVQEKAEGGVVVTFNDLSPGSYVFQVRSVGEGGIVSPWAATAPVNVDGLVDPPAGLANLAAAGGIRQNIITWTNPTDRLHRDVEVWGSSNSTFAAGGSLGFQRGTRFEHTGLNPKVQRWYWARAWNTLGQSSVWVGPVNATTSELIAADIADGILNAAKFAQSISPVGLFAATPATRQFDGTKALDVILNTTDGKLYRWTGSAYVPSIPAVDVTGQLTDEQIADLDAAKLKAGTLTLTAFPNGIRPPEVLAALPTTGNYQGRLVFLSTDNKLYRHAGTPAGAAGFTAAVPTADLSGTISTAQIADAAISTAKFAAGIEPMGIVATLPAAAGYTGPKVVLLQSDGKLYRYTGGVWSSAVATGDLSGTLTAGQFPNGLRPIEVLAALPATGNFQGRQVQLTTDNKIYRHTGTPLDASGFISTTAAADIAGQLAGTQIANGAVSAAKFAAGIEPIATVAALPAVAGYTGPKVVLLSTDGKLYRFTGTAWTAAVPTADLSGTVGSAQIADGAVIAAKIADASIGAGKFAAGLEPIATVAALPAVAGYTGPKVVLLSTDGKLYRFTGTAWTAAVPTADLSGTISTGQIADAALTTAKFAAGLEPVSIVAALPAPGGYTGPKVVFLTTDGKVYRLTGGAWTAAVPTADLSGTVSTAQIADGAISSAKVAANAIGTTQIAAGAVAASKLAVRRHFIV